MNIQQFYIIINNHGGGVANQKYPCTLCHMIKGIQTLNFDKMYTWDQFFSWFYV